MTEETRSPNKLSSVKIATVESGIARIVQAKLLPVLRGKCIHAEVF